MSIVTVAACVEPAVVGRSEGSGGADGAQTAAATLTSADVGTTSGASAVAVVDAEGRLPCDRGTACPLPDDATWLVIDSDGASCASYDDVSNATDTSFRVVIGLPPSRLTVGSHVLANEPDITVTAESALPVDAGASTVAGGLDPSGILDVTEVRDDAIVLSLVGLTAEVSSDGSYAAERCGAALPFEAIATPDGDADVLLVGDVVPTCGDVASCVGDHFQLSVSLPASAVGDGPLALADLETTVCPAGDPITGTVEVLTDDGEELVVRFDGVATHPELLEQELRVGRCAAP